MSGKEGFHLPGAFFIEQRADGIEHPPTRTNKRRSQSQHMLLDRASARQFRLIQPPARLGIAPPGPAARTGRIDQNRIGPVLPIGKSPGFLPD